MEVARDQGHCLLARSFGKAVAVTVTAPFLCFSVFFSLKGFLYLASLPSQAGELCCNLENAV